LDGEPKTQVQFDLVLTLKKLANAKLKTLDSPGTLVALEESLTIARQLFRANQKPRLSKALQRLALSFGETSTEFRLGLEKYRTEASALIVTISATTQAAAQASEKATRPMRLGTVRILRRYRDLFAALVSRNSSMGADAKIDRAQRAARLELKRLWRRGQNQVPAVVHKLSARARAAVLRVERAAKIIKLALKRFLRRQHQLFSPICTWGG
jgi:hypothetical protein